VPPQCRVPSYTAGVSAQTAANAGHGSQRVNGGGNSTQTSPSPTSDSRKSPRLCYPDGDALIIHSSQQTDSSKQYPRTNHPLTHPPLPPCQRKSTRDARPESRCPKPTTSQEIGPCHSPRICLGWVSTCMFQVARTLRDTGDTEQGSQGPILLIYAGSVWVGWGGGGGGGYCLIPGVFRPSLAPFLHVCLLANPPGQEYGCLSPGQRTCCPFGGGRVSRFHLRRVGLTGTRVCLTRCLSLAGGRRGLWHSPNGR
jgi:hypothetical protein